MKFRFYSPLILAAAAVFIAGCSQTQQSSSTPTQQVTLPPSSSGQSASNQAVFDYSAQTQQGQTQSQQIMAVSTVSTNPSTSIVGTTSSVNPEAFGPTQVQFMSGPLHLVGYLSKPAGTGPFPTIIYNHGSEQNPNFNAPLFKYFVDNGYVVLEPIRRGDAGSEGQYIGDLTALARPVVRTRVVVDQLNAQVNDVVAGLNYAKSLPYVDTNRLALMGCSYGGIETLLTAQSSGLGVKAAVDFAGASESWAGNELLRMALFRAVDTSTVPTYFLQAQNDYNTQPSIQLSGEAAKMQKTYDMKIYPAFGETSQQGHGGFCLDGSSVWGTDVLSFLSKYLK